MPITILLVDDHPVFRKGLRLLLEAEKDLKVVGEAGDGQEGIDRARELSPDVVIMDITMPNFNGIDATRQIVSESPGTKIIALSIHSGKRFIEDMLQAGAAGYILKECAPEELINGIRTVLRGEIYLSASVTEVVVAEFLKTGTDRLISADHDGLSSDATAPIISTKLRRPSLPEAHVHRPRLLEKFEDRHRRILTLVSAPAGYGKSALVSDWLETCDCPNAWVSVDTGDSDLRQFLIYFLTAIRTMFPDVVEKTLAYANMGILPSLKVLVSNLLNEMNQIDQAYILALDDIHLVRENQVYELLTELLRHPPPHMHLVIIGRRDPFLPIPLLRAQGQVTEIGIRDLCFTTAETGAYLQHNFQKSIDEKTAALWTEKTEGWVTGLCLAAISIRNRGDSTGMLSKVPAGIQHVTEYFFNEVIAHQPPDIQRFLEHTAILDRFCAPLCDAVCRNGVETEQGESDSWDFILRLKKENLFVISLDAENLWFRYHHLFQSYLQSQLRRRCSSEEIAALHFQAGRWFAESGFIDEAIRHFLDAGDPVAAGRIVKANRLNVLNDEKWFVLNEWLKKLPQATKQLEPEILLAQAWVYYHQSDLTMIPPILDEVEKLSKPEKTTTRLRPEIDYFRGHLCLMMGDGAPAEEHLGRAKAALPDEHHKLRAEVELQHALALHMSGQKDSAFLELEKLRNKLSLPEPIRLNRYWAALSCIHLVDANLSLAIEVAGQLRRVAKRGNILYVESWALYFEMCSFFHRNKMGKASQYFDRLVADRYVSHTRAAIDGLCASALSYQMMKQSEQAEQVLEFLNEFALETDHPFLIAVASSCRARVSLLQEDDASAIRWLGTYDLGQDMGAMLWWLENPPITACRVLIAEGSDAGQRKATALLDIQFQKCQAEHNNLQMIDILSLQALSYQKQSRDDEAMAALEQAVELARPGGVIRPFLELGAPLSDLLNQMIKKNVAVDFIEKFLSVIDDNEPEAVPDTSYPANPPSDIPTPRPPSRPTPQPLVEPLTSRELEILELLAQRLRNKEIADQLFVSIETVKTHLNNIYQKLQVGNRREAVDKAETLGILSPR